MDTPKSHVNKYGVYWIIAAVIACLVLAVCFLTGRQSWGGQPVMVSEFGGTGWSMSGTSWGYGDAPKARDEFINRFKGLVDALLDNPKMCGFCYTQLTDIEQEQNGLYTYDRVAKFEPEVIAPIVSRKAAIED